MKQSGRGVRIAAITGAIAFAALTFLAPAARAHSGGEVVLHSFDYTDGQYPYAGVIQGIDGNFYGTTSQGGANDAGTVFKLTPSGTLTTLYSFCGQARCTDGDSPEAGMIQEIDGNFYGTTFYGGATGGGTVFQLAPSGALTTLYSFCSQANCTDGRFPEAGVIQGIDGNFYGTTAWGGANTSADGGDGGGTVFELTPSGTLTTLYSFCGQANCTDGNQLDAAGVIQGIDGNFYGTTFFGGANNSGEVFQLTPSGGLTALHSFCSQSGCTDGAYPYAGVIQGTDGNFYGTTVYAGAGRRPRHRLSLGDGTVFQLTPSGTLTTLYSFCSHAHCTDGKMPFAGVVQGIDGDFYGTTEVGGAHHDGTVFQLTPSGRLTTLYSFCSHAHCTDGKMPYVGVIQGIDGDIYGTTPGGGAHRNGTVFKSGRGTHQGGAPAKLTLKTAPDATASVSVTSKENGDSITVKAISNEPKQKTPVTVTLKGQE